MLEEKRVSFRPMSELANIISFSLSKSRYSGNFQFGHEFAGNQK